MSITLFNTRRRNAGRASSLGCLFVGTSLALALGACSGSDSDDDLGTEAPGDEESPSAPMMPAADDDTPNAQGGADEDGPNVTDIDESTAPDGQATGGEDDPDAEASGMSMAPVATPDVPETDLCAAVANWEPEWVQFEEEVLLLVNEFRSQPADCGELGEFEPAAPLAMNPVLRCSARLHSVDMFERDYFDHDTPDGVDPFQRMAEAGFEGSRAGENIALGQRTPEEVMQAWMDSDGHCENIMRPEYTLIGIGYAPGAAARQGKSNFWTQNFGTPRASRQRD